MPGLPPGLLDLPSLSAAPESADARWVLTAMATPRFPDGTSVGPELAVGDRVELVVEEGDRARIKKGDRYGWVPLTALSSDPPLALPAAALPAAE